MGQFMPYGLAGGFGVAKIYIRQLEGSGVYREDIEMTFHSRTIWQNIKTKLQDNDAPSRQLT
jgi:hypothetical protein